MPRRLPVLVPFISLLRGGRAIVICQRMSGGEPCPELGEGHIHLSRCPKVENEEDLKAVRTTGEVF